MIKRALFAAVAAVALGAGPATADFPERDITIIIPFSPGGGMDATPRALIPVLPKYLGNANINIIPRNVPGAGGRRGYATLHRAAPDGYTISVYNMPGAAIPQVLGDEVAYDLDEVVWVARMSTSAYLFAVGKDSPIKSFDDLKTRQFRVSSTGFGTTAHAAMVAFGSAIGAKFEFVTGYTSSRDYILATVRGDADASIAPVETYPGFLQAGDVRPIVSFEERSTIPNTPTIVERGHPEMNGLGVHRLLGAPPGTPRDVVEKLSDAIGKAIQDPQVQEWAKQTNRPFHFQSASEVEETYRREMAFYRKFQKELAAAKE